MAPMDTRTRRSVLKLTAATAGVTLVAGCGGPGEEDEIDDEPDMEEGTGNGQEQENGETEDENGETEGDVEEDDGAGEDGTGEGDGTEA